MSLIIKGVDMPQYKDTFGDERDNFYLCILSVNKDGCACLYCQDVNDKYFFPVKTIKTPHGRLIDADELEKVIEKLRDKCEFDVAVTLNWVITKIRKAPTIIEAEVSE